MAAQRKPVNKKKIAPAKSIKIGTVDYKDTATLRKFISERGKVRARPRDRPLRPGAAQGRHRHQECA